jgi:diacylglycerol kinase family enzyme
VDVVHRGGQRRAGEQVRDALDAGCGLLIAAGGDGTLRDIASALAGSAVPLAVLPGGTTNLWAHELDATGTPEAAARAIVTGEDRAMDLGRLTAADGGWLRFMLVAGFGIDGLALERTDARLKRRLGAIGVALGALRAIPSYRPFRGQLRVDGIDAWEGTAAEVVVANTRLYANVIRVAPDAVADDGLLDVTIVPWGDPGASARLAWALAARPSRWRRSPVPGRRGGDRGGRRRSDRGRRHARPAPALAAEVLQLPGPGRARGAGRAGSPRQCRWLVRGPSAAAGGPPRPVKARGVPHGAHRWEKILSHIAPRPQEAMR